MEQVREREIPDNEQEQAKLWESRVKRAKELQEKQLEKYKQHRLILNGKQHDDGAPGLVRTNLVFATLSTLIPLVYAKNPEISVGPSEAVDPSQYGVVKEFGKTLEIVINRSLAKDAKLKRRAKSNVRSAMTTGVGWVKLQYQRDIRTDPVILERVADTQDNIKRIEYLAKDIQDESSSTNFEAKKLELNQQLEALNAQVEVVSAEGLVLDRILTEDLLILDETIKDFDSYPQATSIAHGIWFTKEGYEESFGHAPYKGTTEYPAAEIGKAPDSVGAKLKYIRVWEIWDRIAQTIYTKAEGACGYCREPYQPKKLGERWYPFFGLAFNIVDGQFDPMSDVELLKELQDEYNTTRTNYAEHRKDSMPVRVVRKGGQLTPDDVEAIRKRKNREIVAVEGTPGEPLQNELGSLPNIPLDPAVYDVTMIRNDMDMVIGLSDASRSNLITAKTATEAEILKEGLQSRTSERQDVIEDWIADMAQYSAEILLQELTEPQVERIAGPGYVWPRLDKNEVFDLVKIEIQAGSTGKPNKTRERDQWIQLLPQIKESIAQIAELRMQGQLDMAESVTELLKETLRRFDDRIDLDTFLPAQEEMMQPEVPGQPGQPPQPGQPQRPMPRQAQMEQDRFEQEKRVGEEKTKADNERLGIEKSDQETKRMLARAQLAKTAVETRRDTKMKAAELLLKQEELELKKREMAIKEAPSKKAEAEDRSIQDFQEVAGKLAQAVEAMAVQTQQAVETINLQAQPQKKVVTVQRSNDGKATGMVIEREDGSSSFVTVQRGKDGKATGMVIQPEMTNGGV